MDPLIIAKDYPSVSEPVDDSCPADGASVVSVEENATGAIASPEAVRGNTATKNTVSMVFTLFYFTLSHYFKF